MTVVPAELRIVMVTTKNGTVIQGLLRDVGSNAMILTSARISSQDLNAVQHFVPMDGDVVIPAENIDYWQDALPASLLGIA